MRNDRMTHLHRLANPEAVAWDAEERAQREKRRASALEESLDYAEGEALMFRDMVFWIFDRLRDGWTRDRMLLYLAIRYQVVKDYVDEQTSEEPSIDFRTHQTED